jgi:Leucine-rich repeat (LRR) protein
MHIGNKDIKNYFTVNEYLSLRLENGKTIIYINEEEFIQCKFLLVNIPLDCIDDIRINSNIDELSNESYELDYHDYKHKIPPEVEFWGHCSNLQMWYEYEYDTRLLHRNIAFPLLKKLTEVGDPLAKNIFKEEIVRRFIAGNPIVVTYLLEENYIKYFDYNEFLILLEDVDIGQIIVQDPKLLFLLLNKLLNKFNITVETDVSGISWLEELKTVKELRVVTKRLKNLKGIKYFTNLEILNLTENEIEEIEGLDSIPSLRELNMNNNKITEIKGLENLTDLRKLYLWENKIDTINNLEIFTKLENLSLGGNQIKEIRGLENLPRLRSLDLGYNKLVRIEGLGKLKDLENLDLGGNQLREVKGLESLSKLTSLDLSYNQLTSIEGLEKLQNLQVLHLQHNQLLRIKELEKLRNLRELWIGDNNIDEGTLTSLKLLNSKIKIYQ